MLHLLFGQFLRTFLFVIFKEFKEFFVFRDYFGHTPCHEISNNNLLTNNFSLNSDNSTTHIISQQLLARESNMKTRNFTIQNCKWLKQNLILGTRLSTTLFNNTAPRLFDFHIIFLELAEFFLRKYW